MSISLRIDECSKYYVTKSAALRLKNNFISKKLLQTDNRQSKIINLK